MYDLEKAVGQFVLYHDVMQKLEPERRLYLAVSQSVVEELFEEPIGKLLRENHRVRLLTFDPDDDVIGQWLE